MVKHLFAFPAILALVGLAPPVRCWAQLPPTQEPQAAGTSGSPSTAGTDTAKSSSGTAAPKKIYTNDDLKGMRDEPVSVVGQPGTQKKSSSTAPAKAGTRDQAYWHNRAQKLRDQIADADRQIAQLHSSSQAEVEGGGSASGTNSAYIGSQGNRLRNLETRKANLEKQLDEVEEEARKAGVPPGWLR